MSDSTAVNDSIRKIDETLKALKLVKQYLDTEECRGGSTWWEDKDGYGFNGDLGYFFEALDDVERYLTEKLKWRIETNEMVQKQETKEN